MDSKAQINPLQAEQQPLIHDSGKKYAALFHNFTDSITIKGRKDSVIYNSAEKYAKYSVEENDNYFIVLAALETGLSCIEKGGQARKGGEKILQTIEKYFQDNQVTVKSGLPTYLEMQKPYSYYFDLFRSTHADVYQKIKKLEQRKIQLKCPAVMDMLNNTLLLSTGIYPDICNTTRTTIAKKGEVQNDPNFDEFNEAFNRIFIQSQESRFLSNDDPAIMQIPSLTYQEVADMPKVPGVTPLIDRKFEGISLSELFSEPDNDVFCQKALKFLANTPKGDLLWRRINEAVFFTPSGINEEITDSSYFPNATMAEKVYVFQRWLGEKMLKPVVEPQQQDEFPKLIWQAVDRFDPDTALFFPKAIYYSMINGSYLNRLFHPDSALTPDEAMKHDLQYAKETHQYLHDHKNEILGRVKASLFGVKSVNYQSIERDFTSLFALETPPIPFEEEIPFQPEIQIVQPEIPAVPSPPSGKYYDEKIPEIYKPIRQRRMSTATAETSQTEREKPEDIGVKVEYNNPQRNTVKGDVFEQLVGLYLAFSNPNEPIISQYCLDTGRNENSGHFKTRIDWKVGNQVIEVKWGLATTAIATTLLKHKELMDTKPENKGMEYRLIRFEKVKPGERDIRLPDGMTEDTFEGLLRGLPDREIQSDFMILATNLLESSIKARTNGDPQEEIDFLVLMRNYLNSAVEEVNTMTGEARTNYLKDFVHKTYELIEKRDALKRTKPDSSTEEIDSEFMQFADKHHYSPLRAHFQDGGKIYRGAITIPAVHYESPGKYRTPWRLGDLTFTNKRARDLGIVIEMTGLGRVDKMLDQPRELQRVPIFKLPDGRTLSTCDIAVMFDPQVIIINSLKQAKNVLGVDPDDYRFAIDYIDSNGAVC